MAPVYPDNAPRRARRNSLRERLRDIIELRDSLPSRLFDVTIQTLVLASAVSFAISTLPRLSRDLRWALWVFEITTVIIFTVEYALRVYVAERRRAYILSFFGIIDLLAILPFYLRLGVDSRSLRIFRLLRLFRIAKLLRYNRAAARIRRAFQIAREELVLFLCAAAMLLFLSAAGIYFFEHDAQPEAFSSVPQSLWWAIVTLTAVGYGDVYPITFGGKLFTSCILLIALGIVAVPTGLIASALSRAREEEKAGMLD